MSNALDVDMGVDLDEALPTAPADPAERPERGQGSEASVFWLAERARHDLSWFTRDLTPPQIAKTWVAGLKAAGAGNVRTAFFKSLSLALPMVVEFDCPYWHEGAIVGTFAKVRLLVDREGWVTRYEGVRLGEEPLRFNTGSCAECTERLLLTWLLLCPRCISAESIDSHPEHPPFWDECEQEAGCYEDSTDASPLARVLDAMNLASRPQSDVDDPADVSPTWTVDSASAWLQEHGIDATTAQRAAWEAAKVIDGHPPQAVVRAAQSHRKEAAQ